MAPTHKRIILLSGIVTLSALFVLLAFNYRDPAWLHFGKIIQSHVYQAFGPFTMAGFVVMTYLGSAYVSYPVTGILVVYFLLERKKWTAWILAFNLIGVYVLNWTLKTIVARPRPDLEHLVSVTYYSFPSGHAMDATAFFGFLAFLLIRCLKKRRKPTIWVGAVAAVLIFLIGLSRVYLGVHYPMDILGGFLAGGAWLLVNILIYTSIWEKFR